MATKKKAKRARKTIRKAKVKKPTGHLRIENLLAGRQRPAKAAATLSGDKIVSLAMEEAMKEELTFDLSLSAHEELLDKASYDHSLAAIDQIASVAVNIQAGLIQLENLTRYFPKDTPLPRVKAWLTRLVDAWNSKI